MLKNKDQAIIIILLYIKKLEQNLININEGKFKDSIQNFLNELKLKIKHYDFNNKLNNLWFINNFKNSMSSITNFFINLGASLARFINFINEVIFLGWE